MAETISFVPVEEVSVPADVTADVTPDVLPDVLPDVPVLPDVLPDVLEVSGSDPDDLPPVPKRVRAKAKAKVTAEPKVKAVPKPRARPSKVVTLREEIQEQERSIEQDPEPLLSPDGAMLQHMLNHRMRQRTQREDMYRDFVTSF